MFNYIYIFLFVLLLKISIICSQATYNVDPGARCEPYIGDNPQYPICHDKLVNKNSVYVSSTQTQSQAWDQINLLLGFIAALNPPKECTSTDNYITICSFFFPECMNITNNLNETVFVPRRTCRSSCQSAVDVCTFPYNCSAIDPDTNGPTFPISTSIYNLASFNGNPNYSYQCIDPSDFIKNASSFEIEENCPPPLILHKSVGEQRKKDAENGYYFVSNTSSCVINCPVPLFTRKEWDNLFLMSDIMGMLSTILSLYLVITYVILNKKWTQNDKLLNGFIVSIFFMSLSSAIQTFNGTEKTFCPIPGKSATQRDHTCGAVGVIFQLSSVYAIGFWTVMSFELWFSIRYLSKKLYLFKYYLGVISLVSIIFTIVPTANQQFMYGKGNIICWIKDSKFQNWCFWYPLGACLTVSTGFILLVIYEIYKIVKANGRSGVIGLQLKPILMILLFYCSFLYLFSYNFYIQGHIEFFLDYVVTYFLCILKSNSQDNTCSLIGPPVGSVGTFGFFIRTYGTFCFLIYGFSAKARIIWLDSPIINNKFVLPWIKKLNSGKTNSITATTDSGTFHKKSKLDIISNTAMSNMESGNIDSDDSDDDSNDITKKPTTLSSKKIELSTIK